MFHNVLPLLDAAIYVFQFRWYLKQQWCDLEMNIIVIEIFTGPVVYLAHIIGYFLCSVIVYNLVD
jgi:hypothetical protein